MFFVAGRHPFDTLSSCYTLRGTALELVFQPMPDHERLLGEQTGAI